MSKERKCLTCESKYSYCPNCMDYASFPKWMAEFDKESCKELFNAISAYNMGKMTKADVKEVVDKYGITDFSQYKESIKNKLNELFPVETKVEPESEVAPVVPEETHVARFENKPRFNAYKNLKQTKKNTFVDEANTEE